MKTKSIFWYAYTVIMTIALYGCDKIILKPTTVDFNVNTFIRNIKSYNINGEYIDNAIPIDSSSYEKPYLSLQSYVIKGRDILMSITVPDDAEELYFAGINSQTEYMGLDFKAKDKKNALGYYRLSLKNITKSSKLSNGLANYQVVLSSNEDIQLNKFDLIVSYKSSNGISNKTSFPLGVKSIDPYQKILRVGFKPLSGYTYSINITTPSGGNSTYSFNKDSGTETFNSQSTNSTLSYDSNLDFKWIDFTKPELGSYNMTASFQLDKVIGSQTVSLNIAIVTEGKIDQPSLNVNIQQTGQYTAVGTANIGFGYFGEYKYSVDMEPIMKEGFARIPRFSTQKIKISILPGPLPKNEFIYLELKTDPGTFGSAVLVEDDGNETQNLEITATKYITIKGKQTSSNKENILLVATYKGNEMARQRFSVRTWPLISSFKQVGVNSFPSPLNGTLQFFYTWDSENGNIKDLGGILVGELLNYPGNGNKYIYTSPPYRKPNLIPYWTYPDNPTIQNDTIGFSTQFNQVIWSGFADTHHIPTTFNEELKNQTLDIAFIKPYQPDLYIATQYYRFRDPVLMKVDQYINLSGPHYIRRNIYEDPPKSRKWKYRIEKDTFSAIRELP